MQRPRIWWCRIRSRLLFIIGTFEKTIEAFAVELDEMATENSDKRRKHLLEGEEDREFFHHSGSGRLLEGFQKEFRDSLESNPASILCRPSLREVFDIPTL
ncbi:hypothetical protein D8Y22_13840 [Salinadaptatus halalkaliphilus]|uniref:Uncharacterized protein n=1 Tax=Salinadaptatus halalkaliphilus TaxID=2419781 RepID=A0A4S3TLY3_9EURY|nr:hypothetical protein D8Y22_13840 [Salinadaptatus halalkaliphilus]